MFINFFFVCRYNPKDAAMNSETYHYKKGVNQQFSQVSHVFDPSKYGEDMVSYLLDIFDNTACVCYCYFNYCDMN